MSFVLAIAIGVALGYVGSIPAAGPLAMLVARAALESDRPRAVRLAIGGALAEGIWAAIALLGVQQLIGTHPRALFGLQLVSAIVLCALGVSMLRARRVDEPKTTSNAHVLLGFVLVATQPGFLLAWTTFAAMLAPLRLLVAPIVAGAIVGIVLWFLTLFAIVTRLRERFSVVDRAVRALGVLVIGFAIVIVIRLLRS